MIQPQLSISIAFGILCCDRTDMILRAATELGASEFYPLITNLTRLRHANLNREAHQRLWQSLARLGMIESQRKVCPPVHMPQDLKNFQAPAGAKFVLSPRGVVKLSKAVAAIEDYSLTLCIGPNSGLDEEEEKLLLANDFQRVALDEYEVNTETAVMASIAIARAAKGEF